MPAYSSTRVFVLVVLDVDGRRIVRNFAARNLVGKDSGFLSKRAARFTAGLQLNSAIALAAHHVVDVVRALGNRGAQQEAVVDDFVQQNVDLRFR